MPEPRRLPVPRTVRPRHALLLAVLAVLATLLLAPLSMLSAQADDNGTASSPVRMVLTTAGLNWDDISEESTPNLQCLADRSGIGAMNTTSTTVVSTKRQGLETIHSGYRGLAETAPRTSGIPSPATDQWAQLPVQTVQIDATDAGAGEGVTAADEITAALDSGSIVQIDLGSVADHDDPARGKSLSALDETVGTVLDAAGGCDAADLPRTLLVSVAATDPEDPDQVESTGAVASRTVGLQVAMDSALEGQALTTGSTKQNGIVMLTDVVATVLDSYDADADGLVTGEPFRGVDSDDPQQLAVDRSEAASLVDSATVPALGSFLVLGVVGLVILLVPPLARRPRLAAVGRALATVAPLALPVGLIASIVPWWRADHPTLALAGTVWAGCLILSAVVLLGPWRRSRFGPIGVSAALIALIVLGESATGSRFQLSSPLGAQPISGGRFYGLSNHLFGLVLAASLMALLCLFTHVTSRRARVIWSIAVGAVVAAVCVAPSMGADFGSMLATIPTFGLLALLVSGIRLRPWHVLALCAAGAVAVLGVSFLDWLRPAEDRTHLGRFIDELLSGELFSVIIRKLAQNVAMTTGYWSLGLVLIATVVLSIAVLMPKRLHLRRLAALDAAHPASYSVRIALVAGGWLGYAVNDTGPVLIAAMLGVWLALLPAAIPTPAELQDGPADGRPADDGVLDDGSAGSADDGSRGTAATTG